MSTAIQSVPLNVASKLALCIGALLTIAAVRAQERPALPQVLFFANPMQSDNDVIRRPAPTVLSVAERHFAELSKGIFNVTITQDGAMITPEKLRQFQAVVFFTAINPPDVDKERLIEWVQNGGAFVGIHSTANTYQDYPAFGQMLGATYDRRPWRTRENPQTRVRVKVEDRSHPATRHLEDSFEIVDDIYQFKNFDRSQVQLLLSLAPDSLDLANPQVNLGDKLFPVSWAKAYGEGRVFYTALGDWEGTWKDPRYRAHLIGGIRWAMRRGGEEGVISLPSATSQPVMALNRYRAELAAFRNEFGGVRNMPDVAFYQFGMGSRTKYLFQDGVLRTAIGGQVIRQWITSEATIVPPDYSVSLITTEGKRVRIFEDAKAVWIEEDGQREQVPGTGAPVTLPTFEGHRYASVLRVLHHEILINIVDGLPVPNFYVYKRPWYRDSAMMAMCLQKTANLDLIRDWILGLREAFDRNNAGESEADNPGQALYLISLISDRGHPVVPKLLDALKRFETSDEHGLYIKGRSDFAEHPVYQTKWAKYGLRALGLGDPYTIPLIRDSYSSLFWMDYREAHVAGGEANDRGLYPYLGWATDHFQRVKSSPISNRDYPLTWEIQASQADYNRMEIISPVFVREKTAVPHTWHAAEVFLYLLDDLP